MLTMLRKRHTPSRRILAATAAGFLTFCFTVQPYSVAPAWAQPPTLNLPAPGVMVHRSPGFSPALIKGIAVYPRNPLQFDFIIDKGDAHLDAGGLRQESERLIKYFLAALTTPEQDLWVNLSPYEKERIVPENFGRTEMGRDLLAQDYLLKQLTASLMYPEDELGKRFWDRVYSKARQKYGTTEIPLNTFSKVWIVPDRAAVYENGQQAFVLESRLKIMLEEDYLALKENADNADLGFERMTPEEVREVSSVTSAVVKEILIPELEREINEGQAFARLRQIYQSMILAAWFKIKLERSVLGTMYVDQGKIAGIDVEDKEFKHKIYQQYMEALKLGVFNYIREDANAVTDDVVPRRYFSGGFHPIGLKENVAGHIRSDGAAAREVIIAEGAVTSVYLDPVRNLDRLIGILRDIAGRDHGFFASLEPGASVNIIMMRVIEFLQWAGKGRQALSEGAFVEERVEKNGVVIYVLSDKLKESQIGQAIVNEVMSGPGGIQAINFPWRSQWVIVGFETGLTADQLKKERLEIAYRREGLPALEAYNRALIETGGGAAVDVSRARAEGFLSAQRNAILGASAGSLLEEEIIGKARQALQAVAAFRHDVMNRIGALSYRLSNLRKSAEFVIPENLLDSLLMLIEDHSLVPVGNTPLLSGQQAREILFNCHDFVKQIKAWQQKGFFAKLTEALKNIQHEESIKIRKEFSLIDTMIEDMDRAVRDLPRLDRDEQVDLRELLREELSHIQVRQEFSTVELESEFHGDAVLLRRAFMNILNNARDAMEGAEEPLLSVWLGAHGQNIEIRIVDNGTGIHPDDLPSIFTRYFTTKDTGTGLGLAITKEIIEAHGGEISVESQLGRGTTFVITLPLNGRLNGQKEEDADSRMELATLAQSEPDAGGRKREPREESVQSMVRDVFIYPESLRRGIAEGEKTNVFSLKEKEAVYASMRHLLLQSGIPEEFEKIGVRKYVFRVVSGLAPQRVSVKNHSDLDIRVSVDIDSEEQYQKVIEILRRYSPTSPVSVEQQRGVSAVIRWGRTKELINLGVAENIDFFVDPLQSQPWFHVPAVDLIRRIYDYHMPLAVLLEKDFLKEEAIGYAAEVLRERYHVEGEGLFDGLERAWIEELSTDYYHLNVAGVDISPYAVPPADLSDFGETLEESWDRFAEDSVRLTEALIDYRKYLDGLKADERGFGFGLRRRNETFDGVAYREGGGMRNIAVRLNALAPHLTPGKVREALEYFRGLPRPKGINVVGQIIGEMEKSLRRKAGGIPVNVFSFLFQSDPEALKKEIGIYPEQLFLGLMIDFLNKTGLPVKASELDKMRTQEAPGGIDLQATRQALELRGEGFLWQLPFELDQLKTMPIDGFVPVIIQIVPLTHSSLPLGLQSLEDSRGDSGLEFSGIQEKVEGHSRMKEPEKI